MTNDVSSTLTKNGFSGTHLLYSLVDQVCVGQISKIDNGVVHLDDGGRVDVRYLNQYKVVSPESPEALRRINPL